MRAAFNFRITIVGEYSAEDFASEEQALLWFQRTYLRRRADSDVVMQMVKNSVIDEGGSDVVLESLVTEEEAE